MNMGFVLHWNEALLKYFLNTTDKDFTAAPSNKKSKRVHTETKKEKKEPQNKLLRGEAELQKRATNKR